MPRAIWQDQVIAESENYETVEGNVYFPPSAVNRAFLTPSRTTSVCNWKGTANYYSIEVGGERNVDAAWFYPDPKPAAENIRDYVAFWRGVTVEP
jgi:uncharacterized protein (DUF427 family)